MRSSSNNTCFRIFFGILIVLVGPTEGFADDVGITKTRLIQEAEKRYVIEADATQVLVWAIKAPIFPDRFQVSKLEYVNQAGWIIVRATATTTGEPLSIQDEILLPWMRNGAALTVQWLDGSVHQGLFLRSLEGIRVPMRLLMPSTPSLREVCAEQFSLGLKHLTFKWVHLLFVAGLALLAPTRELFKTLLYFTFGQAFSLVLADVGVPGFDLLFVDILGALLALMLAHAAVRERPPRPYLPLVSLYGLLHGLAYARESSLLGLPSKHEIPALFTFNAAVDLGHFAAAILCLATAKSLAKRPHARRVASYAVGIWSVALLATLFHEHVIPGRTDVLGLSGARIATQYTLPTSQTPQTGGQKPQGAQRLTTPVMSYLSVEPYEVRQEILIQARAAVQFLGVDDKGMGSIPEASLAPVKNGILDAVRKANPIFIDGQTSEPVLARADFVTLGPAGVVVRPEPVVESLDKGIIGLTLVYETPGLADQIRIDWRLFSDRVRKVEATTTDPFGGATIILTPEKNTLDWKSRLSGYRVPVIDEVTIERPELPVVSIALFLGVLALLALSVWIKPLFSGRPVVLAVAALGFAAYPFLRIPVDLPWISEWKPPTERTAVILDGLLTNVYRSFDVRDESRVYDRLAMSVTGDQLSQIYLENRRALELENRGGAQANVDQVEILSVNRVTASDQGGFVADAVWTVSGSVNHFGHTHYRRNKNHALVTFVKDGDAWKIRGIELIEEKRLL
jgi:hypothetical protein